MKPKKPKPLFPLPPDKRTRPTSRKSDIKPVFAPRRTEHRIRTSAELWLEIYCDALAWVYNNNSMGALEGKMDSDLGRMSQLLDPQLISSTARDLADAALKEVEDRWPEVDFGD